MEESLRLEAASGERQNQEGCGKTVHSVFMGEHDALY